MAIARIVTKSLIAASATAVAASQTAVAGSPLTLVGGGPVTLDTQRRLLLTFTESSTHLLAVTGTNQFGNPITETLTATGTGTVATIQDFLTVSSAIPASTFASAVSFGTTTVGSTPWIFLNQFSTPINLGIGTNLTGTATYSAEYTFDNPNPVGLVSGVIPNPWPITGISGVSAATTGSLTTPALAWRLTINSGQGTAVATGVQPGVSQ